MTEKSRINTRKKKADKAEFKRIKKSGKDDDLQGAR